MLQYRARKQAAPLAISRLLTRGTVPMSQCCVVRFRIHAVSSTQVENFPTGKYYFRLIYEVCPQPYSLVMRVSKENRILNTSRLKKAPPDTGVSLLQAQKDEVARA